MSTLPKIKKSVYKHHLKGIDKTISFRPYTNKEQKILLIAKEEANDDKNRILQAIMQILQNCIIDNIDVESLPICDIEDLFIRMRAKSVGEVITIKYSYDYEDENGAKKTDFVSHDINIDQIDVKGNFDADRVVIVDPTQQLGIKLRYPSIKDVFDSQAAKNPDEALLKSCIDSIFDENEVYDLSQVSDADLDEFIDDIEGAPMIKIKEFFKSMPRLMHEFEIYLPKLDKKETKTIKGIEGFFT
jgi:hypothetical protein